MNQAVIFMAEGHEGASGGWGEAMPGRSWNAREVCGSREHRFSTVLLEPGGEQNTTEGDLMASAFLLRYLTC